MDKINTIVNILDYKASIDDGLSNLIQPANNIVNLNMTNSNSSAKY
jgi:hypothetical protein